MEVFQFVGQELPVMHLSRCSFLPRLKWNPVNTVTKGPKKFVRNNEVTVLRRVSLQENVWSFLSGGQKKSGRNNEVAVRRGSTVFTFKALTHDATYTQLQSCILHPT